MNESCRTAVELAIVDAVVTSSLTTPSIHGCGRSQSVLIELLMRSKSHDDATIIFPLPRSCGSDTLGTLLTAVETGMGRKGHWQGGPRASRHASYMPTAGRHVEITLL